MKGNFNSSLNYLQTMIKQKKDKAIMSFKDQGPGLTKEDHKNLFVDLPVDP